MTPKDIQALKAAALALLAHDRRTSVRTHNKLQLDFERLATPERVLALISAAEHQDAP